MNHPRHVGPVIDSHTHADGNNLPRVLRVAEVNGIEKMIDLWNGQLPPPAFSVWKEELDSSMVARPPAANPDRDGRPAAVLAHHTPDLSRIGEPGFPEAVERDTRAAAGAGASGIKVWKNLGLGVRDESGGLVRVDDRRLDPLWRVAGEENLPVSIHVADPVAFFEPLDEDNERYEELTAHPDWWFGAEEFPSFDEIIAQLEVIVARWPGTTFIGLHMGCYAENLDFVARMLDRYSNYYVDTAARIAEFGRHGASKVRDFFMTYADRILFGTDLARTGSLWLPEEGIYSDLLDGFYDLHWRYFETAEKGLSHPFPEQGAWRVDGIDLPSDVLEQLYYHNARRAIPTLHSGGNVTDVLRTIGNGKENTERGSAC